MVECVTCLELLRVTQIHHDICYQSVVEYFRPAGCALARKRSHATYQMSTFPLQNLHKQTATTSKTQLLSARDELEQQSFV